MEMKFNVIRSFKVGQHQEGTRKKLQLSQRSGAKEELEAVKVIQ